MKASELRIGNYVHLQNDAWDEYKNIPMSVTGVEITGPDKYFPESDSVINLEIKGSIHTFNQCNEFVIPIPLTEEWLERFGFENNEKTAEHNKFIWFKNHIGVSGMLGVVKPVECKYVHQLQNLYFALTGEELKLREE